MINKKTISAVIFVYNEERYIGQMLDSIINQTIKIDKIIIVDDFSTDKTKCIIEQYQNQVPQIEYHLSEKKGKIYAYQTGLKKVKTDLFFICAGDDVLMKNFAEKMYNFLTENHLQFAYANYQTVDENLSPFTSNPKKLYYTCSELVFINYVSGYLFGYATILKQIVPLPEDLLFEDWFTSIKLSYTFGKVYISPEPLFLYRRHSKASTAAFYSKEKYYYHLDRNITLFKTILKANFISDKKLTETIQYRILFLQTLRSYTFPKGLRSAFNKSLSIKERLKLLCFPLYFGIKYK